MNPILFISVVIVGIVSWLYVAYKVYRKYNPKIPKWAKKHFYNNNIKENIK